MVESTPSGLLDRRPDEQEEEIFMALLAYFRGERPDPPDTRGVTQEQLDSIEGNIGYYRILSGEVTGLDVIDDQHQAA